MLANWPPLGLVQVQTLGGTYAFVSDMKDSPHGAALGGGADMRKAAISGADGAKRAS